MKETYQGAKNGVEHLGSLRSAARERNPEEWASSTPANPGLIFEASGLGTYLSGKQLQGIAGDAERGARLRVVRRVR